MRGYFVLRIAYSVLDAGMRVIITGSKGLLGSYAFELARRRGLDVLGVDLVGRGDESENYLTADLTDLGQAYDVVRGADAVIHLAAINDQRVFTDVRTFMANVGSTYNVLYAAARMGVRRVVLASSIQVNHPARPVTPVRYRYLPFDEDHPVDPQDEYGLSKAVGELAAGMFARVRGMTILSLRFVWVATPEDQKRWLPLKGDWAGVTPLYFYVDARDAARACLLAATAGLPAAYHAPLLITARDTCADIASLEIASRHYPDAELRGLAGFDSLVSGKRAEQVIGFTPEYHWRAVQAAPL
jgi:nucleoside-diphosphate-sugar epimerase